MEIQVAFTADIDGIYTPDQIKEWLDYKLNRTTLSSVMQDKELRVKHIAFKVGY